ncbi:phosphoribosyltransferase family protein [Martelella alba]|uniref:Adenine phosphoribosyltransferase n=1 Tax=Martelella alba TaxID=2590451 RepID=A0ABY2SL91_9HYPH|nr:phosphoribosyltransferase family protein [Martelella alba]TKI06497.1 adenine phosphoribosyltransferase [Martelella alba]
MLLKEIYSHATVVNSGETLTTVNEFTDQIPALRPQVLLETAYEILKLIKSDFDKIITEEDKGAPLATVLSLLTGKPLAMARWYPYSLKSLNRNVVDIRSEYFTGELYLNGIAPGDKVIIFDDTLSTGGTLISLVKSVENAGGEIKQLICAVEKVQQLGRQYVREKTGHEVESVIKITLDEDKVTVLNA